MELFWQTYLPVNEMVSFFGISIRWYAFFIVVGAIIGFALLQKMIKKYQLEFGDLEWLMIWSVIGGIIGARLYYVIYAWPFFAENPLQILQIYNGGLGIFGAMAGFLLVIYLWCRYYNFRFLTLADFLVLAILPGQIWGRFGNYFNQELFGKPTDGWWGIIISPENRPVGYESFSFFHPVFLYESLLNLLLFLGLFVLVKKIYENKENLNKWSGTVFYFYLFGYAIIRLFLEQVRIDYSPLFLGWRVAGWFSLILLILSGFLIVSKFWKNRKK